jgi:hypothetical protein
MWSIIYLFCHDKLYSVEDGIVCIDWLIIQLFVCLIWGYHFELGKWSKRARLPLIFKIEPRKSSFGSDL